MLDIKGQKWNICCNTNTRDKGVGNANAFTFFAKRRMDSSGSFGGFNVEWKDCKLSNKINNPLRTFHSYMSEIQLKCRNSCYTWFEPFKEFYKERKPAFFFSKLRSPASTITPNAL